MHKILFLCVENSCRSQIAEAFAIKHGKNKVIAMSAGSRPSGIINETAILLMREFNYDLSSHQSSATYDLPEMKIHTQDERFTTTVAQKKLHDAGHSVKSSRQIIDEAAAVEILQSFLDENGKYQELE